MMQVPHLLGPNFHELNRLVAHDEFELAEMIRHTLRLLKPQRAAGYQKGRFGSGNDGAYVMLDDFSGIDTALSFGIEHNINWDRDIADRGIVIHQFDHTVDDPAPDDPRMFFNRTMIAPHSADGTATIEALVTKHDKGGAQPNMILKMDIEAAEWAALDATSLEAISRFSQITCELHGFNYMGDLGWRQQIFRGLRKLSKFYAPIHIHANNFAGWTVIAGVPVAAVVEVAFVNRALYAMEASDELFPGALDLPCDANRADMYLGRFEY